MVLIISSTSTLILQMTLQIFLNLLISLMKVMTMLKLRVIVLAGGLKVFLLSDGLFLI